MKEKINASLDKMYEKPLIGIPVSILVFYVIWYFAGKIGTTVLANYISHFICGIIITLLFVWLRGDRIYSCGLKKRGIKAFTCTLPIIVISAVVLISKFRSMPGISAELVWKVAVVAVEAGIIEELMVRFIPLGNTLWRKNNIKSIIGLSIYSSVIFGLMHLGNVVLTNDFAGTGMQSIVDIFAGLFLVAVYLRTGSIIPGMLCHFLWDYILILNPDNLVNGDIKVYSDITSTLSQASEKMGKSTEEVAAFMNVARPAMICAIALFWLVLTCILLRKSKRAEIVENFTK